MPTGDYVRVTSHALDRALKRVPAVRGLDRQRAMSYLALEAGIALREGRKARRFPRWCVREFPNGDRIRYRLPQEGVVRFLWDEAESMVMLARKTRNDKNEQVWLIITVMSSPGDD